MNSTTFEHFNKILGDLNYAKDFKCPYVLFTSNGQAIGLGEGLFFMKTELNIQRDCVLRNMIVTCKDIASYMKAVVPDQSIPDESIIFKINPVSMENVFGSIGTSIAPSYTENIIKNALVEAESMPAVYSQAFTKEDQFMIDMKALKSDGGNVTMNIDNRYFIMVHKKILNYKAADRVSIEILDGGVPEYFFTRYIIEGKQTLFNVYVRTLKV